MSVVEASDTSESSSESVRLISEFHPAITGEVVSAEVAENPTEEEEVYPGFREAEIQAAELWMQEHTQPEEANTSQEPVQPVQPAQTAQT